MAHWKQAFIPPGTKWLIKYNFYLCSPIFKHFISCQIKFSVTGLRHSNGSALEIDITQQLAWILTASRSVRSLQQQSLHQSLSFPDNLFPWSYATHSLCHRYFPSSANYKALIQCSMHRLNWLYPFLNQLLPPLMSLKMTFTNFASWFILLWRIWTTSGMKIEELFRTYYIRRSSSIELWNDVIVHRPLHQKPWNINCSVKFMNWFWPVTIELWNYLRS
jgi:hypothetical protein